VASAGLLAGALAAAAIAALGRQATARDWYAFNLTAPVHASAGALLVTNARVSLLGFGAAAAVGWWPRARPLIDLLLAAVLAINAALVGAALAAYGRPLLARIGAHTLLELAAAATAGAAYLDARRGDAPDRRRLAGCALTALSLLTAAALVEAHGH
jgi:hypothetical protein